MFIDTQGKQWEVTISVAKIRDVRESAKVDLWNLLNPEELAKLDDPTTLLNVLSIVCGEDVSAGIAGNVFDLAQAALLNAVADFYPSARWESLKTMVGKFFSLRDEATAKALQLISDIKLGDVAAQVAQ